MFRLPYLLKIELLQSKMDLGVVIEFIVIEYSNKIIFLIFDCFSDYQKNVFMVIVLKLVRLLTANILILMI